MKKMCIVIALSLIPTLSLGADTRNSNTTTIEDARVCSNYGQFIADAVVMRDKGKSLPAIVDELKRQYPNVTKQSLGDVAIAFYGFKEKSPDWIGGFVTGKCIGLLQGKRQSSKYITM